MLFRAMEISASGLSAQRLRLDVIASNLANAETTRTATGEPYRRQVVVFRSEPPRPFGSWLGSALAQSWPFADRGVGQGVRVAAIREDASPFKRKYDPGNPDAGPDGFVEMPNVDIVTEMVDLVSATRAYEANVAAISAAKSMARAALSIGRG